MNKMIFGIAIAVLSVSAFADTYVNGYTKKDGTYVSGHYRSDANSTRNDNWSTQGNTNPYTGTYGTKPRDEATQNYNQIRPSQNHNQPNNRRNAW